MMEVNSLVASLHDERLLGVAECLTIQLLRLAESLITILGLLA
jgi:hypothetical protein